VHYLQAKFKPAGRLYKYQYYYDYYNVIYCCRYNFYYSYFYFYACSYYLDCTHSDIKM